MRTLTATAMTTVPMVAALMLGATPASAEPPRPGCGYGDTNHAHQAAPGQDPEGRRPGNGSGDEKTDVNGDSRHTAPPGQAGAGDGDQSGPMRGCMGDPRG